MIQVMLTSSDGNIVGRTKLIKQWEHDGGRVWVKLINADKVAERALLERFEIPDLTISDIQRERHPPKFEVLPNCKFILMRGLHAGSDSIDHRTNSMSILFGSNFVITRCDSESPSIQKAWDALINAEWTPELVTYKVQRNVADRYLPILRQLEDRLEDIEDEMVSKPSDALLAELLGYSRQLKKMRRIMRYKEAMSDEVASVEKEHVSLLAEFRGVHEQFERLASLADLYHEQTSDLINGYISVASHHLNQIMRVLTIVTVILGPLTLLVGIYGMNFDYIPELKWKYGYFAALGLMATIAGGLALLFRRRHWL